MCSVRQCGIYYDFASPDEFYLILTTGESGNVMSPHYKDKHGLWLNGGYIKIRTDETSIRKNKNLLVLSVRNWIRNEVCVN